MVRIYAGNTQVQVVKEVPVPEAEQAEWIWDFNGMEANQRWNLRAVVAPPPDYFPSPREVADEINKEMDAAAHAGKVGMWPVSK